MVEIGHSPEPQLALPTQDETPKQLKSDPSYRSNFLRKSKRLISPSVQKTATTSNRSPSQTLPGAALTADQDTTSEQASKRSKPNSTAEAAQAMQLLSNATTNQQPSKQQLVLQCPQDVNIFWPKGITFVCKS